MAYSQDLKNSARRHLRSATELASLASAGAQPPCGAVAGYLYGIAGELALKEMMRQAGIRPLDEKEKRSDPYFAHFPELQTLLTDSLSGRNTSRIQQAVAKQLFQNWNTKMRYAPTNEIGITQIQRWKRDAETIMDKMENP